MVVVAIEGTLIRGARGRGGGTEPAVCGRLHPPLLLWVACPGLKYQRDRSGVAIGRPGMARASCAATRLVRVQAQAAARAKEAIEAHVEAFGTTGVIEANSKPPERPHRIPPELKRRSRRLPRWRRSWSSLKGPCAQGLLGSRRCAPSHVVAARRRSAGAKLGPVGLRASVATPTALSPTGTKWLRCISRAGPRWPGGAEGRERQSPAESTSAIDLSARLQPEAQGPAPRLGPSSPAVACGRSLSLGPGIRCQSRRQGSQDFRRHAHGDLQRLQSARHLPPPRSGRAPPDTTWPWVLRPPPANGLAAPPLSSDSAWRAPVSTQRCGLALRFPRPDGRQVGVAAGCRQSAEVSHREAREGGVGEATSPSGVDRQAQHQRTRPGARSVGGDWTIRNTRLVTTTAGPERRVRS